MDRDSITRSVFHRMMSECGREVEYHETENGFMVFVEGGSNIEIDHDGNIYTLRLNHENPDNGFDVIPNGTIDEPFVY